MHQDESNEATWDSLIRYSVTDAAIAELKNECLPLKVFGVDDGQGYALCKEARNRVRDLRLSVEKRRKELKAESLDFGRKVDAKARAIREQLEEIENHLVGQLAIVDDEKKRREQQAALEAKQRLNSRVAALQAVRAQFNIDAVAAMTDEAYEEFLDDATTRFNAEERKRKEQEAELEKLRAEEAAREAKLKAQEEETRRLQAELIAKQQEELRAKEQALAASQAAEREATLKAQEEQEAREREKREADRKAQEEREAREREARQAEEAAAAKAAQEAAEKAKAEAAAREKVADQKLFDEIKAAFPTLESAWVEIARLRKAAAAR